MVDLITLDNEKIYRVLTAHDLPKPVVEIIIEIHETQRATQQLVNELMAHQAKIVEALRVVNAGFANYGPRLQAIEKKFSGDDLGTVTSEHLDG